MLELDGDQLGLVLRHLQLVDVLAVLALACTCQDLKATVWDWLCIQTVLTVNELPPGRPRRQIFSLIQVVRKRLSGAEATLNRFYVGKSFFCFNAERDGRDKLLYMYCEATAVAQLLLPFFEVTSIWHHCVADERYKELLQRANVHECNLGDIGASSVVFALRTLDVSAVTTLGFRDTCISYAGVKEVAGLLAHLPALTKLDLSCNDLSAAGKRAITRACRCRKSTMPNVWVVF